MKTLIAEKCKDGWYVQIIETRYLSDKTDVLKQIREEGLKYKKQFSNDKKIYAD